MKILFSHTWQKPISWGLSYWGFKPEYEEVKFYELAFSDFMRFIINTDIVIPNQEFLKGMFVLSAMQDGITVEFYDTYEIIRHENKIYKRSRGFRLSALLWESYQEKREFHKVLFEVQEEN